MALNGSASEPGADVVLHDVTFRAALASAGMGPISLAVAAGEAVALTGPPGSGTSEVVHLIAGLQAPQAGRITVGGARVDGLAAAGLAAHRSRLGLIMEDSRLWEAHTALDNVLVPVLPYRSRPDPASRARDLLVEVGLQDQERRPAGALTDEQRLRLVVARALINAPRLVLADDPTARRPLHVRDAILDLLIRIHAAHGMTLLLASGDLTGVSRFRRVVTLGSDGSVAAERVDRSDPASTLEWVTRPAPHA